MKDFGVIVHFESETPKTKHISVNVERDEAKIKKYEDLSFLSEHGNGHDFYLKKSY